MTIINDVIMPLLSIPPNKVTKLLKWCVPNGYYVCTGQVIMEVQIEDEIFSVESIHSGYLRAIGLANSSFSYGDVVGKLISEQSTSDTETFCVELDLSDVCLIDEMRGLETRRDFLSYLVKNMIRTMKQK